MQPGNSRKITVGILAVITIALIAGAAYLTFTLQQNQAPDDTSAFGFGEDAITDYFDDLDGFFESVPCNLILNNGLVISVSNGLENPLLDYQLTTISDVPAEGRLQRRCDFTEDLDYEDSSYDVDNPLDNFISLDIRTYDQDSYIYESAEEKEDFINSYLVGEVIDSGTIEDHKTKYYFGRDPFNSQICNGVIYHETNEFEFASLRYYGYTCDDQETIFKNLVYVTAISSFVDESINSIYGAAGFNPYD